MPPVSVVLSNRFHVLSRTVIEPDGIVCVFTRNDSRHGDDNIKHLNSDIYKGNVNVVKVLEIVGSGSRGLPFESHRIVRWSR